MTCEYVFHCVYGVTQVCAYVLTYFLFAVSSLSVSYHEAGLD